MENLERIEPAESPQSPKNSTFPEPETLAWQPGTELIYGLQGRCTLIQRAFRNISGTNQEFFHLQKVRSPLSRSQKPEPAIWVPTNDFLNRGLRAPASRPQAEAALDLIRNREHFFSVQSPWSILQSQLDTTCRREGFLGLSKAYAFLKVLEKRQIVLGTEAARLLETVSKQFIRELGDALGLQPRETEVMILKAIRPKLAADQ